MSYYPLALVILLAFAGGWVWRGVFDLWRTPKAKVYGTTGTVSSSTPYVQWSIPGAMLPEQTDPVERTGRLRAVE